MFGKWNNVLVSLVSVLLFTYCSDAWIIDRDAKTLAGSVTSIEDYCFEGSIDGIAIEHSIRMPHRLILKKNNDNSMSLSASLNLQADLPYLFSISIPEIMLYGHVGSVSFNQKAKLTLFHDSTPTELNGEVSGWLNVVPITKTSPIQPDLDGEIHITWNFPDSISFKHHLLINRIISKRDPYLNKE